MKHSIWALALVLALAGLTACAKAPAPQRSDAVQTPAAPTDSGEAPAETVPETPDSTEPAETPSPDLSAPDETLPEPETSTEEAPEADAPAESPEEAQSEPAAQPPVLMRTGSFTGLTPLETNNDYRGGYLYADQTADGLTVIYNCCFATDQVGGTSLEDYIAETAQAIGGEGPREMTVTEDAGHSQRLGYPVYLLTWQTGDGTEARTWDGFFCMTEGYTYLYAFCTTPDNAAAMSDTWQSVFGELYLFDPTAP